MESDYDHPILLRMINEEVKRMNKEYNGADPAKLDGVIFCYGSSVLYSC